ncbi:trigger factor [Dietzia sp.]|uniref:trigger factor n=1 Tax=Dietzia sp. TaxID=1871616 RepID=UPI002FDB07CD
MKSTVEQLASTRVKITVEVPFEELKPDFDRAYKALAGQVNVPGFRPGKAPAKIIEARVGRGAVLEQVVNDMIPARYSEALTENDVNPLAQPEIEVTKIEDNDVVEFVAEVDVRPEITVPEASSLDIEVPELSTSDEDIDAELDNLRARFGTLTGVERAAKEGDFLSIDLSATVDGEPVPEATTEGLSYEVGSGTLLEGLEDAVQGLSAGESADFTTKLLAGEHADKDASVTVKVNSVKERELPEADDDFAQMASEFDTIAELKENLGEQVAERAAGEQAEAVRDAVLEALLEKADFEVPEGVVDAEAHQQIHNIFGEAAHDDSTIDSVLEAQGTSREEFDAEVRQGAERSVRTQLLLDAAAEGREDLEVGQDELMQHIMFQAQRNGMDPNQFLQQVVQNNQIGAIYADVRRSKALAELILGANVKDTAGNEVDTEKYFGAAVESEESDASESDAVESDPAEGDEK